WWSRRPRWPRRPRPWWSRRPRRWHRGGGQPGQRLALRCDGPRGVERHRCAAPDLELATRPRPLLVVAVGIEELLDDAPARSRAPEPIARTWLEPRAVLDPPLRPYFRIFTPQLARLAVERRVLAVLVGDPPLLAE